MGIAREIAAEAVEEVFRDINEEEAIERAIAKKTRGRPVRSVQERARLHRLLLRQGFTPGAISAALRHLKAAEDQ